jgi:hypothetical protein
MKVELHVSRVRCPPCRKVGSSVVEQCVSPTPRRRGKRQQEECLRDYMVKAKASGSTPGPGNGMVS